MSWDSVINFASGVAGSMLKGSVGGGGGSNKPRVPENNLKGFMSRTMEDNVQNHKPATPMQPTDSQNVVKDWITIIRSYGGN